MTVTDSITPLAFSVFEAKGVYALLLGSGLSRSAEVPTGWEITLDLVRRVGLSQGVDAQADWAAWYRDQTGEEPDYSKLLAEIASSPDERRAILHSYIEPSPQDREDGRKAPTRAHHAIAALVAAGFIRVIITTNFDRLMENALREAGVEPTIVASVDALSGAEPITHSACYLLKLHGDYKDARILNTDEELKAYPAAYDGLLDRILDEHGLIVAGWSGVWDHALRAALLRAPNRRYGAYWATRGERPAEAAELIQHRRARVIPIKDADTFFEHLKQRIDTLEQTRQQNPQSIDLMVASAKRYLSKPEHRIQLRDLIDQEMERLLTQLSSESADLSNNGTYDKAEWRRRVGYYEAATEALASMLGLLGRWGDGTDLMIAHESIEALYARADNNRGGLTVYVELQSYPAVLAFTAYGVGLVRAERWRDLHEFLRSTVNRLHHGPTTLVEALFLGAWDGGDRDIWRGLEGFDRHRTPLSDHLLSLLSRWGRRFLGPVPDYELVFERFEMLASLAHFERNDPTEVLASIETNPQQGWAWMPIGRSSWHGATASKLIAELESPSMFGALMAARFGNGQANFIEVFIRNFRSLAGRMKWE
ncbi:SIR2 family protein [Brevundimonas sp.]|jgi:hypothetical protein|uniref:SIR2 family protein n=1 Tax=Brevundimonas sp. TaxID=1871086 RepID=UPI0037C050A7